jgi:formylglycine-generating enzyme required for sulfatase activity
MKYKMPLQKLIMICLLCALAGTAQAQCYQSFLNDGKTYAGKGLWDKAIAAYNDAKQCQSDKPANGDAVLNGLINEAKKQKQAAIDRKKQADADRRAREQADAARRQAAEQQREQVRKQQEAKKNIPLPVMISVAGGEFDMGSNDGESDEKPVHKVRVKSFYLSRYETTNAEFCAFLNEKGNQSEGGAEWIDLGGSYESEKCRILRNGERFSVESGYERHPVIYVNWYGAVAYCKWLSEKTGQAWRLPSEAEWEYAAGGGSSNRTKWAGTNDGSQLYRYANFCDSQCKESWADKNQTDGHSYTAPVGSFSSNALVLNDMSGNVWEWCADTWHDTYEGAPADGSAWTAGGEQNRAVLRGGSWDYYDGYCRAANRNWNSRLDRYSDIAFRVARGGGAN